ncbi:hypothetical protein NIES23_50260 [Trichormus variabilis NIES-23]|uniref:Uncharacterized protein n=1 Tax=Trichormus variabilis NIES-23 TaxID=1973479 RepID=A0A1Z4KTQ4_ANAVA|nr:hypothetical protein NIES23_50260 [Trichormus variabilis NIES-23]
MEFLSVVSGKAKSAVLGSTQEEQLFKKTPKNHPLLGWGIKPDPFNN